MGNGRLGFVPFLGYVFGELGGGVLEMVSKTTSYGTVSVIGRRREMEDAVRAEQGFWSGGGGESYDFYGVYDGHCGARVAEVFMERLHRVLAEEIEIESCRTGGVGGAGGGGDGWERAMKRCFAKVDEEVVSGGWCRKENGAVNTVGSTAAVGGDVVAVANCGDSRAVICRDGVAIPLSNDHKVKNTSYTNQYCPSLLGPVGHLEIKLKPLAAPLQKERTSHLSVCFPRFEKS